MIYIGGPKTGFGLLRRFISNNLQALTDNNICIPQFSTKSQSTNFLDTLKNDDSKEQKLIWDYLKCNDDSILTIINAEEFADEPSLILKLSNLLKNKDVKLVSYLRRQDYLVEKIFKLEALKIIESNSKFNFKQEKSKFLNSEQGDYYKYMKSWTSVFGQANIIVRPFEESQWKDLSFIKDLFQYGNIEWSESYKINKKIPVKNLALNVIGNINNLRQGMSDVLQTKYDDLAEFDFPGSSKPTLNYFSNTERRDILTKFNKSNKLIELEFLNRKPLFTEPLPILELKENQIGPKLNEALNVINSYIHLNSQRQEVKHSKLDNVVEKLEQGVLRNRSQFQALELKQNQEIEKLEAVKVILDNLSQEQQGVGLNLNNIATNLKVYSRSLKAKEDLISSLGERIDSQLSSHEETLSVLKGLSLKVVQGGVEIEEIKEKNDLSIESLGVVTSRLNSFIESSSKKLQNEVASFKNDIEELKSETLSLLEKIDENTQGVDSANGKINEVAETFAKSILNLNRNSANQASELASMKESSKENQISLVDMVLKYNFEFTDEVDKSKQKISEIFNRQLTQESNAKKLQNNFGGLNKSIDKIQSEAYSSKVEIRLLKEGNRNLESNLKKLYLQQLRTSYDRPINKIKRFFYKFFNSDEKYLHIKKAMDVRFYQKQYPQLIKLDMSAEQHFVKEGVFMGLNPNQDFDVMAYLENNPNLIVKGINPYIYYLKHN